MNTHDDSKRWVCLWILRILDGARALRRFVKEDGVGDDDVAEYLGIQHLLEGDKDAFDRDKVIAELKKMRAKLEAERAGLKWPTCFERNVRLAARLIGLNAPRKPC